MARASRVLVVEDEPGSCWALAELLREEGREVATAVSGPEALAQLAAFAPDALIADLRLPGMNGLELLRQVHALSAGCRLILTSVYARPRQAKEPPFDYLPKPIDADRLRSLLDASTDEGSGSGVMTPLGSAT